MQEPSGEHAIAKIHEDSKVDINGYPAGTKGICTNPRLDSSCHRASRCHFRGTRSFLRRLAGIPKWYAKFRPNSNAKGTFGKLESIAPATDSTFLSHGQDILGESQKVCRDGDGDRRETGRSPEPGRIVDEIAMPFLHLGVYTDGETDAPDRAAIEHVLNNAKDWFRYAPYCWIIYTGRDAAYWSEKLRAIAGMEEHAGFLLAEVLLDPNKRSGWLKRSAWDWMNKDRGMSRYRSSDQT